MSTGWRWIADTPWAVPDAIIFARAVEALNITWLEDMIAGDYTAYVNADVYRDVTQSTLTPIHTGEQIYLRQTFKSLIEGHARERHRAGPCDVGGIAKFKWVAEYRDLHGIVMAPHGTGDGLFGLAALVQVCATLPHNFIAFEYPIGNPEWWYDIVDGLPSLLLQDGFIDVEAWTLPCISLEFRIDAAKQYLRPEDADFFD